MKTQHKKLRALTSFQHWLGTHYKDLPTDSGNMTKRARQYLKENPDTSDYSRYGKLQIIHKNGQPYGIRDDGGYLLFFPKVTKYYDQEERYIEEIQEAFILAKKIVELLTT